MNREGVGGLLWPTVFAVVGVAVLAGLGTWQMQRKAWKEGLISQIEARAKADPIPLADALGRFKAGEDLEYQRVRAQGRFMPGREAYYWAPTSSGPGWHVYAPLVVAEGGILIVNRGHVSDADRDPARRPEALDGERELIGLLRKPEAGSAFVAANDPDRGLWYWRDLDGMARALLGPAAPNALPFAIDAERTPDASPLSPSETGASRAPRGGTTRLELPNNHLQYALTWYGLALTLVGVYMALAWSRLRPPRSPSPSSRKT